MDKLELTTIKILRELEITANKVGYHYIKTAVRVINENPLIMRKVMNLYEKVAGREGSTPTKVERGIRTSIECAESDSITQRRVLGTARHLCNSDFLATLHESVRIKLATEMAEETKKEAKP